MHVFFGIIRFVLFYIGVNALWHVIVGVLRFLAKILTGIDVNAELRRKDELYTDPEAKADITHPGAGLVVFIACLILFIKLPW